MIDDNLAHTGTRSRMTPVTRRLVSRQASDITATDANVTQSGWQQPLLSCAAGMRLPGVVQLVDDPVAAGAVRATTGLPVIASPSTMAKTNFMNVIRTQRSTTTKRTVLQAVPALPPSARGKRLVASFLLIAFLHPGKPPGQVAHTA